MGVTFGKNSAGDGLSPVDLDLSEESADIPSDPGREGSDDVERGIERLIRSASPAAAPAQPAASSPVNGASRPVERKPAMVGNRNAPAAVQRELGEQLVDLGHISRTSLEAALAEQDRSPFKLLGKILEEHGAFADAGEELQPQHHDVLRTLIDPAAVKQVPRDLVRAAKVLPISTGGGAIIVALSSPRKIDAIEELRPYLPAGARVKLCFWPADVLDETIDAMFEHEMAAEAILKGFVKGTEKAEGSETAAHWADPAVRLVNAALLDAVRLGASHAHFEPVDGMVRLRYRVDGAMKQASTIDKRYWAPVAAHLHRIAEADGNTDGKDAPGEFRLRLGDRIFMCALRAFDTLNGERMTIRMVEIAREPIALSELGLSDHSTALVLRSLVRPSGMIVAAGGRASGRTTTLYGMLGEMKAADRSIFTVERRIGYRLPLVSQLEVSAPQAAEPEELVAEVVAQDPDVILFDRLQTSGAARALTRAASAGRLVLTSMDAPDALSALTELMGMVEDPRQLAGRVTAIVGQRLVRRLCSVCKESRPASGDECFIFGLDPAERVTVYHPKGCPSCRNTGYRGRTVVSEVLVIDDDMNDLIASGASIGMVRALAFEKGFQTLADDGVRKVLLGEVGPSELARAVDLAARL